MADKSKINEDRDKLLEEIGRLETNTPSATKKTLPRTTLQEKQYDAPDDATLKSTAEGELADYKRSTENSLKQKSEAEQTELNAKRDAYETAKENSQSQLEKQYEQAARSIDNDVVKRGLARSSVATAMHGELEREYLNKSADVVRQYTDNIAKLESDIAAVNKKLQDALNDFNLTYAAKLNQRLNELKQDREKKMQDVIEYNNEIKQKQAKLDNERLKTESDLYTAALNQEKQANSLDGLPAEKMDELYKAVYKRMDEFLGAMDPETARIEFLNHSLYRQHLSNFYYNRLYDKYGRDSI